MNLSFGDKHQIGSHWFINLQFYFARGCSSPAASQLPAPEPPCGLPAACAKRSGVERTKRIWFSGEVSKSPSVLPPTPKHLLTNTAAFTPSPLSVDSAPPSATPSGACCCLPLK